MKKILKLGKPISLIIIILFLFNGCAVLFHGTSDKVSFNSEPSKCKVYINGQFIGNTPMELKLQSNKSYAIEFKKDGYLNKTMMITNGVAVGYVVLDVLFGLIPVVIDAATGAWYSLDQDYVVGVLEKK